MTTVTEAASGTFNEALWRRGPRGVCGRTGEIFYIPLQGTTNRGAKVAEILDDPLPLK